MSLFWSFSIAGGFLPLILRAKGISTSADLDTTYRNYVWVYLPGTVATIIAAGLMEIPRLGRRWAMVVSAGLMGMSLFLFATASSFTSYTVLNGLEYFMQSMCTSAPSPVIPVSRTWLTMFSLSRPQMPPSCTRPRPSSSPPPTEVQLPASHPHLVASRPPSRQRQLGPSSALRATQSSTWPAPEHSSPCSASELCLVSLLQLAQTSAFCR